jgi:D-alanine-D-alanine ligase
MGQLMDQARKSAGQLELVFVTNLRSGEESDFEAYGIVHEAQYYTRREANQVIQTFQNIGALVTSFFDEIEFIRALTLPTSADQRRRVVYTAAESGRGSGRRALIPALCQLLGIPVLNSGAHASTLARHKFHANAVLGRVGVPAPETWLFESSWIGGISPPDGEQVIVKPCFESMSNGVDEQSVQVVDSNFLEFVMGRHHIFGQPAVVQQFISGREVCVPLARIHDKTHALPPIQSMSADGRPWGDRPKTFTDEVVPHRTILVPFIEDSSVLSRLCDAAVTAFDALGMEGAGRIDFRVDRCGDIWAFDTNEAPPPLDSTSYAIALRLLGFSAEDMLALWLGMCLDAMDLLGSYESDQKDNSEHGSSRA